MLRNTEHHIGGIPVPEPGVEIRLAESQPCALSLVILFESHERHLAIEVASSFEYEVD